VRHEYVSYSQGRTDGVTPRRGREVDTINFYSLKPVQNGDAGSIHVGRKISSRSIVNRRRGSNTFFYRQPVQPRNASRETGHLLSLSLVWLGRHLASPHPSSHGALPQPPRKPRLCFPPFLLLPQPQSIYSLLRLLLLLR
jgi:hypothetical protein